MVGLNNNKEISSEFLSDNLNTNKDDYLIAKAMQAAITVVQNKNNVLPLEKTTTYGYLKLGDDTGLDFRNSLSKEIKLHRVNESLSNSEIISNLKDYEKIIIGFHRSNDNPWKASSFSKKEIQLISELVKSHTIILDVFVKPYALSKINTLEGIDGLVVSYQNNIPAQIASADILLGDRKATGKLPVSISSSFPVGMGIELNGPTKIGKGTPESVGIDSNLLNRIDDLALIAIDSLMTPGMQILVARNGKVVFNKSYGFHTYEKKKPVTNTDLYDLASLTKVLATLPLVMKEVDQGKLTLETR